MSEVNFQALVGDNAAYQEAVGRLRDSMGAYNNNITNSIWNSAKDGIVSKEDFSKYMSDSAMWHNYDGLSDDLGILYDILNTDGIDGLSKDELQLFNANSDEYLTSYEIWSGMNLGGGDTKTYSTVNGEKPYAIKDSAAVKQDDDGSYYVQSEPWTEENASDYSVLNTLGKILEEVYGVQYDSEEGRQITAALRSNPQNSEFFIEGCGDDYINAGAKLYLIDPAEFTSEAQPAGDTQDTATAAMSDPLSYVAPEQEAQDSYSGYNNFIKTSMDSADEYYEKFVNGEISVDEYTAATNAMVFDYAKEGQDIDEAIATLAQGHVQAYESYGVGAQDGVIDFREYMEGELKELNEANGYNISYDAENKRLVGASDDILKYVQEQLQYSFYNLDLNQDGIWDKSEIMTYYATLDSMDDFSGNFPEPDGKINFTSVEDMSFDLDDFFSYYQAMWQKKNQEHQNSSI